MRHAVVRKGIHKFLTTQWRNLAIVYLQVPFGLLILLAFAYGLDLLISLCPFVFPAPVVGLVILFLLLVLLDWCAPTRGLAPILKVIEPSCNFALTNMGLFFTPSFILIPARELLPGKEIGLIIALFVPTQFGCFAINVVLCKLVSRLSFSGLRAAIPWRREALRSGGPADLEKGRGPSNVDGTTTPVVLGSGQLSRTETLVAPSPDEGVLAKSASEAKEAVDFRNAVKQPPKAYSPDDETKSLPASRRDSNATLVKMWTNVSASTSRRPSLGAVEPSDGGPIERLDTLVSHQESTEREDDGPSEGKGRSRSSSRRRSTIPKDDSDLPQPVTSPLSDVDRVVHFCCRAIDPLFWSVVFIIGLPLFYTPGGTTRSLPLFLGLTVLAWIFAKTVVPPGLRKVFHPILTTSFVSCLSVWGLGAIKGLTIRQALGQFSTSTTYIELFSPFGAFAHHPGAGDVLTSVLDAGIIALAVPLFHYRGDLYRNFLRLVLVLTPNCLAALFLWPFLAKVIGIKPERALAFGARFMSTPLGIEFVEATGPGDEGLTVVLICVTGIVAVIFRDPLFRLFRTRVVPPDDDFFTVGATIGVIAGAIGTSSLNDCNSRAMVLSTSAFALFGLILLVLVAIPAVANTVAAVAGLSAS